MVFSKRGFGAPQMLSIILITILGIIFLVIGFFSSPNPVKVNAEADIIQSRAFMVLNGVLQSPMKNPPDYLKKFYPTPTIGDFVSSRNFSVSEDVKILADEFENVFKSMVLLDEKKAPSYSLLLNGRMILVSDYSFGGFSVGAPSHECSDMVSTAKMVMPSSSKDDYIDNKNNELILSYCWVSK